MSNLTLPDQTAAGREPRSAAERDKRTCQVCGGIARVHVLVGYQGGKPQMNEFCIACSTHGASRSAGRQTESRERIRLGSILIFFGVALAVVGASGAIFGISGREGFGWYQRLGVGVGALVAICGGLMRVELLALAGAIVAGLSAGIDFVATERSQSGAWISYGLACVGLFFMLAGLLMARRVLGRIAGGSEACRR